MGQITYTYRLPFPPSVNHYWRRHGHTYFISGAGKEFRALVIADCSDEVKLLGRLAVNLEFTMPDRRRRDLDNLTKCVLDSLAHAGVYEDDCQIDLLRIQRLGVEAPGACDVTITELMEA